MNAIPEALHRCSQAVLPVLLDSAAKGAVLLAAAGLAVAAMRRSSAAARQAVWVLALAGLLAILDGTRSRRALTKWGLMMAAILASCLVVPIALLRATAPEEPAAEDANSAATRPATKPATKPATEPSAWDAKALEGLWEALADADADAARGAIWALADQPQAAAGFLAGRLRPAAPTDAESLRRLIADLDSDAFAVRQAATAALASLDCLAEPALAEAAKGRLSAEAGSRIGQLLEACRQPLLATGRTRQIVRGIWALETIGTAKARSALEQLGKGDDRHRASPLARAALARLDGRGDPAGPYVPRLRYEVRPLPGDVKAGGKIWLEARLTNEGNAPVAVYWGDVAYEDMYCFAIRRDGKPVSAPQDRLAPAAGAESRYFREIAPGETLTYRMVLGSIGANCQHYFFRYPGAYAIEPGFAVAMTTCFDRQSGRERPVPGAWTGELKAAPLSVTVKENPDARGDLTLSGKVADAATDKPLPGAKVVLMGRRPVTGLWGGGIDGQFVEDQVDYAFTGADGQFSFGRLAEDVPQFVLRATHADYVSASAVVNAAPPAKEYQAAITMQPGLRARGRVVDSAGLPVAGARVDHADKSAYTDKEGRFVLPGVTASLHDGNSAIWMDVWRRGFVSGRGWPTPQEARGGQWTMTLLRESELAFSGRAAFADNSAAADVALEFRLKDAAGRLAYARGQTDGEGRFSVALPRAGEFSGRVEATGGSLPGYNSPRERWLATVEKVSPGSRNVRIVFVDRGEIRAAVRPANSLPESLKFRVLCDMADVEGQYRTVRSEMLGSRGGTAAMQRLSSGKYRVTVTAVPPEHWNWTKDVVLDANDPARAVDLEFDLPALRFGGVRAAVMEPDGNTPVANGHVWLDSSAMAGRFPIVDGAVDLKDVPVGRVWLTTNVEGMGRQTIRAFVREGQITDLGRIVLQSLEDATGLVAGRVLYDDGTPALGAALVGDGFARTPVLPDGNYAVRLLAGEGTVVIDLVAAVGWPKAAADAGRRAAPWGADTVLAPVQVPPRETVQLDIVLPRKKMIDLGVDFRGTDKAGLGMTLAVELDRCRLVRTWFNPQAGPGVIRIPHLPSGPTTVSLYAAGAGFRSCQAVPEDKLKDAVVFDPSVTGTLTVRIVDRRGKPVRGVPLSVRPEPMAWLDKPVRGLRSDYFPIGGFGTDPDKTARVQRELDDGTVELTGLGPGPVVVRAAGAASGGPVRAEVQAGKNTPVQVIVDTDEAVESPPATQPAATHPAATRPA